MPGLAQQRSGLYTPYSLVAPIGGLNTRDAKSAMPETDAIDLVNWFPTPTGLFSRNGYSSFCTGLGNNVETLAEYHAGAVRKFIAAAGGTIWEIGSGTAISLGTGFSNARWQWANFNAFINLVNGVDAPQKYDGTTLSANGWTGSGLTPENLIGVHAFKNRLYYWEASSQDFWYGGINAITGTLTKFPLSRVGQKGGNLIAIKSITRDGGSGPDDVVAFFMSSGTVIVYQGSDPGTADTWSIQGIYNIGAPISVRSLVETKGDIKILTRGDEVSLLQVMTSGGFNDNPSKLSGAISADSKVYGSNYGWQAVLYPKGNMIVYNVPLATNSSYIQYVQNTITGAFTKFTGWNARCFGTYNNALYFGGDGVVYKADDTTSDNGGYIVLSASQAFSRLGLARKKRINRYRPITRGTGQITLNTGLAFDYGDTLINQSSTSVQVGTPWDTSLWDVSYWSPEAVIQGETFTGSGVGDAISIRLGASIRTSQLEWYRTDFAFTGLTSF